MGGRDMNVTAPRRMQNPMQHVVQRRSGLTMLLCIGIALLGMGFQAAAAEPIPFRPVDALDFHDTVFAVAQPYDDPADQWLLVGRTSAVEIYRGLQRQTAFSGFLGNVTALAMGDFLGNGGRQVAVATDNAGALHIFEERDGQWQRVVSPVYLWTPATELRVVERSTGGWYLAALSEQGELNILVVEPEEGLLHSLWRSGTQESVKHLAVADLTGDGRFDLVFTRASGYLAVLQLEGRMVQRTSERYPWGPILALGAADRYEDKPAEVFVVTGDHTVYRWQWLGGELQLQSNYEAAGLSRFMGWNPKDGLWSSSLDGTIFWSVERSALSALRELPRLHVQSIYSFHGQWLAQSLDGQWQLWEPVDIDFWEVFVRGELSIEIPRVHWHRQTPLFAVGDLAALLGLRFEDSRLFHGHTDVPVTLVPGERRIHYDETVVIYLEQPVLFVDDTWFAPAEIVQAAGWDVEKDTTGRSIEFQQQPDWLWLRSQE